MRLALDGKTKHFMERVPERIYVECSMGRVWNAFRSAYKTCSGTHLERVLVRVRNAQNVLGYSGGVPYDFVLVEVVKSCG